MTCGMGVAHAMTCLKLVMMFVVENKYEIGNISKEGWITLFETSQGGENRKIINSFTWQGLQLHSYIVHTSMVQL